MSIFIQGMEFPKEGHIIVRIHADGMVEDLMEYYVGKAIPVPPHGDLVDRAALRKNWLENYKYALTRSILDSLDSADTIIPAEEVKT